MTLQDNDLALSSPAPVHVRLNVLGTPLVPCCAPTATGDGCCDDHDAAPTICVVLTPVFIAHGERNGAAGIFNPAGGGRRAGDNCCIPAALWLSAQAAGIAPPVILKATDASAIDVVPLEDLMASAAGLEPVGPDEDENRAWRLFRTRGSRQVVIAIAALFCLMTFFALSRNQGFWLTNTKGYTTTENSEIAIRPALTLPFQPPIGTPVTYAFERRIDDGDRTETIAATVQLVFFSLPDGGMLLKWVSLPAAGPGTGQVAPQAATGRNRARLSHVAGGSPEQPLLYRLSRRGKPLALLDEAEALALLAGPRPDATALTRLRGLLSDLAEPRSLPRDPRLDDPAWQAAMLEAPRTLLHGYDPLSPAGPTPGAVVMESPFGGGAVRYERQSRIVEYVPGQTATVAISAAADTASARQVAKANIDIHLATVTDPVRRLLLTEAASAGGAPALYDDVVKTIALPSGLATRVTQQKRLAIPGEAAAQDVITYTRIR
ncbi:MAG: hypothetical protein DCF31_14790 [Alphaproteobacteria bacterium]|nr:MAG: hypothetical protein DCF31_14790 [Alphaproteobacteria bacterium]